MRRIRKILRALFLVWLFVVAVVAFHVPLPVAAVAVVLVLAAAGLGRIAPERSARVGAVLRAVASGMLASGPAVVHYADYSIPPDLHLHSPPLGPPPGSPMCRATSRHTTRDKQQVTCPECRRRRGWR